MYVCICNGITDHQIRDALENGARNFRQVSKKLGVASQCGSCEQEARAIIDEFHQQGDMAGLFYAAT